MFNLLYKLKALAFYMLALFFFLMWVLSLLLHGWAIPFPSFSPQKPLLLIGLALFFFLFLMLINRASISLARISEKKLVFSTLILYFCLQSAFIVLVPVNAYQDAAIVNQFARQFLEGNFTSLGIGNYLGYYPNNIGITLFIAFIYSFLPNSYITLRVINAIFNTVSAWIIYRIYKELYPERQEKAYGLLLLAVTFIPPVILNNFTYGDIISNTFCLAAVLNALSFARKNNGKYAVYTALFLMAGNFMRSVTLLFLVAILIYWLLNFEEKLTPYIKKIAYGSLSLALFNLPLKLFSLAGTKAGIIVEPVGVHSNPIWRWINMGVPLKQLGYWDGGRNMAIFVNRFKCNKHDASIFFMNEIMSNFKNAGLLNVLKAYIKKTFWLWTEGTYSVNFYGLSQALNSDRFILYSTPLIKYFEPWDKTTRLSIDWLLHSFNWLVLGLVSLYLFDAVSKKDLRMELFVYVIYLYIGFYMFWEVKSRYIFGVYPIFLLICYCCSERIFSYIICKARVKNLTESN